MCARQLWRVVRLRLSVISVPSPRVCVSSRCRRVPGLRGDGSVVSWSLRLCTGRRGDGWARAVLCSALPFVLVVVFDSGGVLLGMSQCGVGPLRRLSARICMMASRALFPVLFRLCLGQVCLMYRVDWAERNTTYNSVVSYFSMRPLRTTMQARYCDACVAETSVPWLTSPSRS